MTSNGKPVIARTLFRWITKAFAGVLLIVLTGLAITFTYAPAQDLIFRRVVTHILDRSQTALFEDNALRAIVCGSGTPQPSPKSAKACIAVIAGGKLYIVDTGARSSGNLVSWRLPVEKIGGVFLTHFHSDHIGDLGELNMQSWTLGRAAPLNVYGPPGVDRVVAGFSQAYNLDQSYRSATHGVALMALANGHMVSHTVVMDGVDTGALDRSATVLEADGLKVTAIEVNHKPVQPAYAYRFDYKGRSLVISGDTSYHLPLAKAAKDTDVLFHEAQAKHMVKAMKEITTETGQIRLSAMLGDIQQYHTTTLEAADIANKSSAKLLAIYHADPPVLNMLLEKIFTRGMREVRPENWLVTQDGTLIELPLKSTEIRVDRIDK
jgi:ribonuclease Z